jgi:DNA processing protein
MSVTRLSPGQPGYPELLARIERPPELWVRGGFVPQDALAVAVVGTRRATPYGLAVAEELGATLVARGITVVSGLARGIDTAAHRGALRAGGRTVAVLGSGVDVAYPPENRALLEAISRQGAVVSPFPPGTPPRAHHFPARNRIIAALALGVVVVEAPAASGALITAALGAEFGREIFAVPGPVTSPASAGCHELLQDGAKLVRDWRDIVAELPEPWRHALADGRAAVPASEGPSPHSDEGRVWALLSAEEPQHIDTLVARGAGTPGQVAAALVALELEGRVRQLDGQRWVRSAPRRT